MGSNTDEALTVSVGRLSKEIKSVLEFFVAPNLVLGLDPNLVSSLALNLVLGLDPNLVPSLALDLVLGLDPNLVPSLVLNLDYNLDSASRFKTQNTLEKSIVFLFPEITP